MLCAVLCCAVTVQYAVMTDGSSIIIIIIIINVKINVALSENASRTLCSVLCCAVLSAMVQYAVMTDESSVSLCSVLCCDGAVCCDD